jgi:predicted RNase H-like nuclease (RuvC/YqgF family)
VQPHLDANRLAQEAYVAAHKRLIEAGWHVGVAAPSPDISAAFQAVAETMARWQHVHPTAEKAQRWVEAREQAVRDLEFQVQALRAQRQRVEETYEQEQDAIDAALIENGKQISALDDELMRLGERLAEPLRPRAELGPLFAELET